jgi:hypothetical protein
VLSDGGRLQLRLAGWPMAELCREHGISRRTGCKIFDRWKHCGMRGLGADVRIGMPVRNGYGWLFDLANFRSGKRVLKTDGN